ncbi:LamB/YcsF family protein [Ideonella sp. 4Y16]|uniref:5-oxoprolinase subunit A n=1 Tax=Ideonella alba TaxID=2824118 RepID=A0A941BNJ4_9BURK|nr:5-oxoprolinase subunit PxpA [Ideonella alba]MBQ0933394.1 LamB/YcsF family protein [Ideonella alba]MBQ0943561.1 LamB/YcsF family protein [Ideonella alba]
MSTLDLNCDMGEGFGAWTMGDDLALLDHVSSANIACGFHAGDPATMRRVVAAAVQRGVAVGAHPGLPDLVGFGRREMKVSPADAYAMTLYQAGALAAFARAAGGRLHHVKPHGALYNMAARDRALADALAQAVHDLDPSLVFYGLAGSAMVDAARARGLRVAEEVFADRAYEDDGRLAARGTPGAMIENADAALAQVRLMLQGQVRARSGALVALRADTLCLHGDQPGALHFAQTLRAALATDGVTVRAP